MYKKAALAVGITLIVIALGIYSFRNRASDSHVTQSQPEPTQSETQVQPTVTPTQAVEVPTVTPIVPTEAPKQRILEIDSSTLETPKVSREVMLVASKRLLLVDEDTTTKISKVLTYTVALSGAQTVTFFPTVDAYNSLEVGQKVVVEYCTYSNAEGVNFYVVKSVTLAQ